ncbi:YifB family Mg chelatase-like AAA ATPase [sulfur-oxidizing endosymbiont of Gigantopelta aegis]|uniref:YifB family Mg chelatase-like AAA ATPase n=1 Tax=sulfur-oxidizing endosymbiont of Gigantopelta aegis TaxID=2794934 RepID=UPI0018DCFA43|nr:YifB family Mg chelatase-like AAA ATPase [sulfur-oxidizing endosymbiont of Gigantopelta aegis]
MSLSIVYSRAGGLDAPLVTVEVLLTNGLPSLGIVGLPETAVKESKDRVRGAIINSRFDFPVRRITINLAPADLPKEGGRFDLAIALGILLSSKQVELSKTNKDNDSEQSAPIEHAPIERFEFVGELALSGELRGVKGILPIAVQAKKNNRILIVPEENGIEASLIKGLTVYTAKHLLDVCAFLKGEQKLAQPELKSTEEQEFYATCLSDIRGQQNAKRALEIAAAGQHSLLMKGPPGTGKTMLASRLVTILPNMSDAEAEEVAAIRSVCGEDVNFSNWAVRGFRVPHHTASGVALVGGGSYPKPGEISLAHHGVLFMDELPEFSQKVLEVLREPLESGRIAISRAAKKAEFPASFQLIAAMNPCPCGYWGDVHNNCRCTSEQVQRYQNKLSGPFLDRIDMHIDVPAVSHQDLQENSDLIEQSSVVKKRVITAQNRQRTRRGHCNAHLTNKEIEQDCRLSSDNQNVLEKTMNKMKLSARAYHRILKLARTIADLDNSDTIELHHLTESIGYRKIDHFQ